jgi:hypothetical protein
MTRGYEILSRILESRLKGISKIKILSGWDTSNRDPFFHKFHDTKQISLFQLEVLRQVFKEVEM